MMNMASASPTETLQFNSNESPLPPSLNPSVSPSTKAILEMLSLGEELKREGRKLFSLGAGSPAVTEALSPFKEPLIELWEKAASLKEQEIYAYSHPQGSGRLRQLLTERTNQSLHRDRYNPDQILITNGGQEALFLLAITLPQPVVLVPKRTYLGAIGAFTRAGKLLVGVDFDKYGMIPEALKQEISDVRSKGLEPSFVYANPSFTNPTGEIMPFDRRYAIYAVATESGIRMVDDDPYKRTAFLGYEDLVPDPLAAIENNIPEDKRIVIKVDSLSKVLAPGLRTGWIACDDRQLINELVLARSDVGLGSNLPVQRFLELILPAEVNENSLMSQILENYRIITGRKKELMSDLFDKFNLRQFLNLNDPHGGLFFWGVLKADGLSASQIRERLHQKDGEIVTSIACSPPQNEFNPQPTDDAFRINFSGLSDNDMPIAIEKFSEAIQEELDSP